MKYLLVFTLTMMMIAPAAAEADDLERYAKMLEAYRAGDQLQIQLLQDQLTKQAKADAAKDAADVAAAKKQCAPQPKKEHQRP